MSESRLRRPALSNRPELGYAGESSSETVFHYRQKGSVVWATYRGGDVAFGTLLARLFNRGRLEMVYQHLNKNGDFRAGSAGRGRRSSRTAGTVSTSPGSGRPGRPVRAAPSPRRSRAGGRRSVPEKPVFASETAHPAPRTGPAGTASLDSSGEVS